MSKLNLYLVSEGQIENISATDIEKIEAISIAMDWSDHILIASENEQDAMYCAALYDAGRIEGDNYYLSDSFGAMIKAIDANYVLSK